MDESEFKKLSVKQLGDYLQNNGVSKEAIATLVENNVSGLALLLVDKSELKELLKTIGDRAIVRNLLLSLKKVSYSGNKIKCVVTTSCVLFSYLYINF